MSLVGLEFPADLFYDIEAQTWARLGEDGLVTVGITALGIRQSGEIYMCRPKGVGQSVDRGRSIAVVELAKSIVSVKSPLAGVVAVVNDQLAERPELVHESPYGAGWLARLQPHDWAVDGAALVPGAAVLPAMVQHAWLNKID